MNEEELEKYLNDFFLKEDGGKLRRKVPLLKHKILKDKEFDIIIFGNHSPTGNYDILWDIIKSPYDCPYIITLIGDSPIGKNKNEFVEFLKNYEFDTIITTNINI